MTDTDSNCQTRSVTVSQCVCQFGCGSNYYTVTPYTLRLD